MKHIKFSEILRYKQIFPIWTKRPNLVSIIKKGTCHVMDFAVPENYRVRMKENKKIDKYLNPDRQSKEISIMNVTVIPIVFGALKTVQKDLETGETGDQRKKQDYPDHSTVKIR